MKREDIKDKLVEAISGGDAYNRGIKKANRTAKIWINKTFDHFEKELKEVLEATNCPNTYGFEGLDTFPDCGECAYCKAKKRLGV